MIFLLFIWRIGLFVVSVTSQYYYPFTPSFPYSDIYLIPSGLPRWVWAWANFDGVHYLTIATRGYFAQFTQTFFPVYPLILNIVGKVFFDKYLVISGIILSFGCITLSIILFQKLLSLDFPIKHIRRSIIWLLLFPTSFYFAALYTEAFFYALIMYAFWYARKRKWWIAGIFGMAASATRFIGIFLLPALLWEHLQESIIKEKAPRKKTSYILSSILHYSVFIIRSPILYLVPIGLLSYMVYLQMTFGDALLFWHAQGAFGAERLSNSLILPVQVIWRYVKIFVTNSYTNYNFWVALTEFMSFLLTGALLIIGHRQKIRLSYLIFGWFNLLVPTLTGTLSSLPRYILVIFPIFIVLGSFKKSALIISLWIVSAILLIIFTTRFVSGFWIA